MRERFVYQIYETHGKWESFEKRLVATYCDKHKARQRLKDLQVEFEAIKKNRKHCDDCMGNPDKECFTPYHLDNGEDEWDECRCSSWNFFDDTKYHIKTVEINDWED